MLAPARRLESFLAKYTPEIADQGHKALVKMRKLTPGAIELVYDNYNGLVIGFSPDQKPSHAVFSIFLVPSHVTLCFLQGKGLPDPTKRLRGSGNIVRHTRLESAGTLDEDDIVALIEQAKLNAKVSFNPRQRRDLIIQSVSAKQRPRRPAASKRATSRRKAG